MGFIKLYLNFILIFSLTFFFSFLLSLIGFFYSPIIIFLTLISFIWIKRRPKVRPKLSLKKQSLAPWDLAAFSLIIIFALYLFLFSTPSYLEGRDPGAMVEATVMLTREHRLEFKPASLDYFNNHNSNNQALNYPGFTITQNGNLKTLFNTGYISYLAFFYDLLGETGLRMANLFGIILGLMAVYLIIKKISKSGTLALSSLPLFFLSLPFYWHTRQNFSESIAFGFLFSSIYLIMRYYWDPKKNNPEVYLGFLCLFNLSLIRAEGLLVSLIALILAFSQAKKKKIVFFSKQMIAFLLSLSVLFLYYATTLLPFWEKMIKEILNYKQDQGFFSKSELGLSQEWLLIQYLVKVFYNYSLLLILTLGIIGIIYALKTYWLKIKSGHNNIQNLTPLIPLILSGIFLVYLIKPNISLDHPWVLRRFMFAVIPLAIIYLTLLFNRIFNKRNRLALIALTLMALFQLNTFLNYGFLKENPRIKEELSVLSNKFKDTDLILVDSGSSPDNWSLISAPLRYLFNKNAVYIFNPNDINNIPSSAFANIYLLCDPNNASTYQEFIDVSQIPEKTVINFEQLKVQPFSKQDSYQKSIELPAFEYIEKNIYIYKIKM